jgi:hypothetical protein
MSTPTPEDLENQFSILWREWSKSKSPSKLHEIVGLFETDAVVFENKPYRGHDEITEYLKTRPKGRNFESSIILMVNINSDEKVLHVLWHHGPHSVQRGLSVVYIRKTKDDWKFVSSWEFDQPGPK